jgi:prepilin-type N-terminal cleavage/methylation domain-containing protein
MIRNVKYKNLFKIRPGQLPAGGDRRDSGFSVVELLIALTLMAFLAASLMTILTTGSDAFQKVLDDKNAQSEARIAVSYISVKLRQYSSRGRVSVVPSDSPTNIRNVLKIDEYAGISSGESRFIYFEESTGGGLGRLVEKNSVSPRVDDPSGAHKIADISDFSVAFADESRTVVNISVSCDAPNGRITREVSITLRS